MISVEKCKEYLGESPLTDEQIESLRSALYALVENIVDDYISSCANIESTCKKQLSIVECLPNDREVKAMA